MRNPRSGTVASGFGALLSVLLPGAGHRFLRRSMPRTVAWAVVGNVLAMVFAVALAWSVRTRADVIAVVASRRRLVTLTVSLAMMGVARGWTAVHAAWISRPRSGQALQALTALATGAAVVGGAGPLAIAANYTWKVDRTINRVFADHATTAMPTAPEVALPIAPPAGSVVPTTAASQPSDTVVAPSTTAAQTTTTAPLVGLDRINMLVLGGDAGPGRWNLRADSMIVVSIDPVDGDTVMISVPRNLRHLPFPAGTALAQRFPNGFNDLANAVYPYVDRHRGLAGGGADAPAQALKLGVAQLLGMPIHYYVLADMAGFVNVVDALGGIDITVGTRVPSPGNPGGAKHPVPAWIEAGRQHMDGTLALAYARSRSADNDYRRMARQRCVLAAIANVITPATVASGFGSFVDALGSSLRTDIPRDRLVDIDQLAVVHTQAGGLSTVRTVQLTPPLVEPARWNLIEVRALVASVVDPTAAPTSGEPAEMPSAPAPPVAPAPARSLGQECS